MFLSSSLVWLDLVFRWWILTGRTYCSRRGVQWWKLNQQNCSKNGNSIEERMNMREVMEPGLTRHGLADFNLRSKGAERSNNSTDVSSLRNSVDAMSVSGNWRNPPKASLLLCTFTWASHLIVLPLIHNEDGSFRERNPFYSISCQA